MGKTIYVFQALRTISASIEFLKEMLKDAIKLIRKRVNSSALCNEGLGCYDDHLKITFF